MSPAIDGISMKGAKDAVELPSKKGKFSHGTIVTVIPTPFLMAYVYLIQCHALHVCTQISTRIFVTYIKYFLVYAMHAIANRMFQVPSPLGFNYGFHGCLYNNMALFPYGTSYAL